MKQNHDEITHIICVACPKGCQLETKRVDGELLVSNAGCKRGKEYAVAEVTDPRRMVASSVRVRNGKHPLVPVYTSQPFPKGKIFDLLALLRKVEVQAPVEMGEVILPNALDTKIDILASRDLSATSDI